MTSSKYCTAVKLIEYRRLNLIKAVNPMSEKIAALICIWFVVFINCYSVKLTQKFLKFFGYGKIVSLAVIIGGGIYFNLTGKAEQRRDSRTRIGGSARPSGA